MGSCNDLIRCLGPFPKGDFIKAFSLPDSKAWFDSCRHAFFEASAGLSRDFAHLGSAENSEQVDKAFLLFLRMMLSRSRAHMGGRILRHVGHSIFTSIHLRTTISRPKSDNKVGG